MTRQALLLGSMPFENEEVAMTRALDALGDRLFSLPDGEIGEKTPQYPKGRRIAWVMTVINRLAEDTENWQVVQEAERSTEDGMPVDYDKTVRLKPRHSPAKMRGKLYFGYHDFFNASYPIFKRLREERGLSDLKFQVGVPTGLGVTFSMMNPLDAFRYAPVFAERIAYEVNQIVAAAPDDVVIQVEAPGEVAFAYQLPGFLVGVPVRFVTGLVKRIDPRAEIGVHLCLGDLNNIALVQADTLDKLVHFSNKLADNWPATHKLAYMHYPLAEAADPPPVEAAYYAPLKGVHLPGDARFVAGFVHEKRSTAEHGQILTAIESLRGGEVDVACSCGLGRRPTEAAARLIDETAQVAAL